MRLPLVPAPSFLSQLPSSPSDPPLVFIDHEPFLVELQGSLEGPTGEPSAGQEASKAPDLIEGARVGKVDLSDPKKPVLRIAHHRLEGKLETLLTPYALLRTSRVPSSAADLEPPSKRARRSPSPSTSTTTTAIAAPPDAPSPPTTTRIELVALIRRKLVFSKRPEPLVDVSSEADPLFADKKRRALAEGAGGGAAKRVRDERDRVAAGAGGAGGAGAGGASGGGASASAGAGAGAGAGAPKKVAAKSGFFAPRKAPAVAPAPTAGGAAGGGTEGAPPAGGHSTT